MKTIRLVSWNVNGIRAAIRKGFEDFLSSDDPDIICLQETKARPEQVELDLPDFPYQYWNSAEKKGYSGTAIFSRVKPLSVKNGLGIEEHDKEGRVITLEFAGCFLVTVYTPNSQNELRRLDYRTQSWDTDFLKYVRKLEKKKPVIFCGDLNVAHKPIDLANPGPNKRNAGFTDEERAGFDNMVSAGFHDTFRMFNQEPEQYTWWSFRARARERNIGWRIDYFCVSDGIKDKVKSAGILPEVHGSDHCPVTLEVRPGLFKG